jgi:tetratricopeptide (TPR) repeat protein
LTLKKAVALSPKDEFTHTTLGIVFYRQAKFDEALAELTKSLGLNPKSSTAHNYLGITASQKGWQEAAEKELLEAISENPKYADAHFNLAVIYATSLPLRENRPSVITPWPLRSAPRRTPLSKSCCTDFVAAVYDRRISCLGETLSHRQLAIPRHAQLRCRFKDRRAAGPA